VAALLADVQSQRHGALPERCVVVVDEAGMVPTRQIAALLDAVAAVDGKLVLVGDHRQLPELGAGGAFRGMVNRGLAVELTENRRQVHAWERRALDHLREGRPGRALDLYRANGRVVVEDTTDQVSERLVDDWQTVGDPEQAVMIAARRADEAELNVRGRERLRAAGALGADELNLAGGRFAVGDHVVVKLNDQRHGVLNGDRARVSEVDLDATRLVLVCRGRQVSLDASFLAQRTPQGDPTLGHGYAITAHVAQGVTVEHGFVLAGPGLNRELGYTALSRGRHSNRLYVAAEADSARKEFAPLDGHTVDPVDRLVTALGTSAAGAMAIDSGARDLDWAQRLEAAERSLSRAVRERRSFESSAARWASGRRKRVERLRSAEGKAQGEVARLTRERHEHRHATRPFVDDRQLDDRRVDVRSRGIERRLAREQETGRGIGR